MSCCLSHEACWHIYLFIIVCFSVYILVGVLQESLIYVFYIILNQLFPKYECQTFHLSSHHTQVSETIFQKSLVGGDIISCQPVLCSSTNIQFLTWGVMILLFKFICYHKHLRSTFNFSSATSVSSQTSSINAWYKKTGGRPLGLKWILGITFHRKESKMCKPENSCRVNDLPGLREKRKP